MSTADPFGAPRDVQGIGGGAAEPCVSPDGTELFFSSNRSGNTDIYRVAILAGP